MYGTVARLRITPGAEDELMRLGREGAGQVPGSVFYHVYRSDADPQDFYLVVGFDSEASYRANAQSPEQHAFYERYRALLAAEPEWHDGEIVDSYPAASVGPR